MTPSRSGYEGDVQDLSDHPVGDGAELLDDPQRDDRDDGEGEREHDDGRRIGAPEDELLGAAPEHVQDGLHEREAPQRGELGQHRQPLPPTRSPPALRRGGGYVVGDGVTLPGRR